MTKILRSYSKLSELNKISYLPSLLEKSRARGRYLGEALRRPLLSPGKPGRPKSPAQSRLGFERITHPIYSGFREPLFPRNLREVAPPSRSRPARPRFAAPPAPGRSLAVFPFGLLCGARTPRSGGGARTLGLAGSGPRRGRRVPISSRCAQGLSLERRREPSTPRDREPESPRCEENCRILGGRGGGGALAEGWLGHCQRPGAELPPLASIPRPRSQTPPHVPSVLQSIVRPRGHLDAGSGSWGPAPMTPPRPAGHGPSRLALPQRRPHFLSPRCGRCWNGRGFWPSVSHLDICLATVASILYNAYKKLSSQSLLLFSSLSPLSFSSLNPGGLWVEH